MNWAFQSGHTTKVGSPGRGLALDVRELYQVNKGCLEVFSHDGYARIEEKGKIPNTGQHVRRDDPEHWPPL